MLSGDDDWLKRALTILAVVLGVSSAGTLISKSKGGPAISVPAAATAASGTTTDGRVDTSVVPIPGVARPFAMLRDFLEPAGPMPTVGCAPFASDDAIARLRAVADCKQISVHFVIATVPDWIDSSLQWTFDPMIDAIQMAAGQMDYVASGYFLPDSDLLTRTSGAPARSRG